LQAALACFEGKKKLLQQANILKDAFVVTSQEPLPDELVTAVQVTILLCSAVELSVLLHTLCAVLCCAVLCCAVLCCAVLCCAVLCQPDSLLSSHSMC